MLHFISWGIFARIVLVLTGGYYTVICLLFYRKEIGALLRRRKHLLLTPALLSQSSLYAQTADGNNGLSQANTMVRGYFDTATQLMYAIGAIVGLIGAVKIITRKDRHEISGEISLWFACCIFLVIAATVLKSFYGL